MLTYCLSHYLFKEPIQSKNDQIKRSTLYIRKYQPSRYLHERNENETEMEILYLYQHELSEFIL